MKMKKEEEKQLILYNFYYVPSTFLSTSYRCSHLVLMIMLWGRYYIIMFYKQGKGGTCPASNLLKVIHPIRDNLVFEPRQYGSRVWPLNHYTIQSLLFLIILLIIWKRDTLHSVTGVCFFFFKSSASNRWTFERPSVWLTISVPWSCLIQDIPSKRQ